MAISIDPAVYRKVLGHFPTGVVAVTAVDEAGDPVGMTVGSFTSVSLDPPLVAFLPAKSSSTFPAIGKAGHFCVNVLTHEQESVCRAFATKGADRFANIDWQPGPSGAPRLTSALAWIDCDIDSVDEAGDHYIVVGRVVGLGHEPDSTPLLFFQGGYGRFSSRSLTAPAERDLLAQLRLVDAARSEMESLADRSEHSCIALARVGDEVVLVGSASPANAEGLAGRVGQRWPCAPPFGAIFVAWSAEANQQAWLERVRPDAGLEERNAYDAMLERVRQRGWSLAFESQTQLDLLHAIEDVPLYERTTEQTVALSSAVFDVGPHWHEPAELAEGAQYKIRTLGAPVFGPDGEVVLELVLFPIEELCTRSDILAHAAAVTASADRVTQRLATRA
jgi:flavin reductase (DIM6/NTAB) family NADH-FMN oxidoreductase RutF/DNA-binding IclR family transcriptional regulator